MKLLITRHGETEESLQGLILGQKPGILTQKGREDMAKLAERIKGENIELIISSDLNRCKDSAKIINKCLGNVPVEFNENLREISSGVLDGGPAEELKKALPTDEKERANFKPDGGESLFEFQARIERFIEYLLKKELPHSVILIVTHSLWIDNFTKLNKDRLTQVEVL